MNRPHRLRPRPVGAALGLGLLVAAGAAAQPTPPRPAQPPQNLDRDPGYVDFGRLESWFGDEAKVEIDVRGALLRMVASSSRREDPELATMLGRLRAVQVRVYPLTPAVRSALRGRTSELARGLRSAGWESVVRVRDEGSHVDMMLRTLGDHVAGLMVMVMDDEGDDEAVFINIVGDVDPDQVGRIGERFGVRNLPGKSDR